MPEYFTTSPHENILLTQGSRQWADRMLRHLGLREFFPDDRILAFEDVGMVQKSHAPDPFYRALDVLKLHASEVALVEDSIPNMVHAHALGLTTHYVHHGKPLESLPPHVHHQHHSPVDVFKHHEK